MSDSIFLSVPETADLFGWRHAQVRSAIKEHRIVAFRNENGVVVIPARQFGVDPQNYQLNKHLRGTLTVLMDAGFLPEECWQWLTTANDDLHAVPLELLESGNIHGVRRAALVAAAY